MKMILLILLTLCAAARAVADEANWLTSFPEAASQAKRENKLVLFDFTGSDWCGWCKKLDEDTFSRPEFIDYANKNLVLVQVDFPKNKNQSDELKEANRALKKKYDVSGFPSLVIANPDGKTLWNQTGYAPGGPGAMIRASDQCRKAAGLAVVSRTAAPPKPAAPAAPAPVRPPAQPVAKAGPEPKLQGILYSANHSSAVLDGWPCEVGETVHDMRVVKITRDAVTVEFHGQTKVLKMN